MNRVATHVSPRHRTVVKPEKALFVLARRSVAKELVDDSRRTGCSLPDMSSRNGDEVSALEAFRDPTRKAARV